MVVVEVMSCTLLVVIVWVTVVVVAWDVVVVGASVAGLFTTVVVEAVPGLECVWGGCCDTTGSSAGSPDH